MAHSLIRFLCQARYVTFSTVVVLLVLLAWAGKRVTYDQSISSFFADDDPDMQIYQKAAATFGDDNFAFVVYDDPALLTPAGMDRVAELAAALGPDHVPGAERVESIDSMPQLWAIDDALLALDRLPEFARKFAKNAAKNTVKKIDLKSSSMTVAVPSAPPRTPGQLAALKDRLTRHPLFLGTLIDKAARPRPWSCA